MKQVLIIDDDFMSLEFMKIFLEDEGFEVLSAPSEKAAFAQLNEHKPVLIITDVDLGEGSGINVAKHVKEMETPIRIIGVTGYSQSHLEGVDAYHLFDKILTKPINLADLRKIIQI